MSLIPGSSSAPSIHANGVASGSVATPLPLLIPYGVTGQIGNVRASSSTAQTLVNSDNDIQIFTPTAAHDVNLPTTSVASGRAFYIVNRGGYNLTIKSSNGNTVITPGTGTPTNGVYVVRALQAAPTTAAHWQVEYAYEVGTFTPTVFGRSTAGAGTYTIQNGAYSRINNLVTVSVSLLWTAHTGSGTTAFSLPYTSFAGINTPGFSIANISNFALTASNIATIYVPNATAACYLQQYPVGGGASSAVTLDTSAEISFSGTFPI